MDQVFKNLLTSNCNNMNEIATTYQKDNKKYDDFRIKVEELIKELLLQRDIRVHKIESRCKEVDKLDEKINRKNNKYGDILEITDIIGIRVITYFEDEVDIIASIIEEEFVKDSDNSIDKRNLEMDRFGYKSLHYVVSLKDDRKELTEYKRFKDIKFEIQIRSVLQHAWAEIEHDIGYKSDLSLPNSLKRDFYRVAALLETADIEFVKIKDQLKEYEKNVEFEIKDNPEEVEINDLTVKTYLLLNKSVLDLEIKIARNYDCNLLTDEKYIESRSKLIYFLEISTIEQLDRLLNLNKHVILEFANKWTSPKPVGGNITIGISIILLLYVLVGQKDDLYLARRFMALRTYSDETKTNDTYVHEMAQKIIDICKEIK